MKKSEIRRTRVLKSLVEEYVHNYEPVSSGLICKNYVPDVSPATVRIDLHKLEETNYIYQPHTSAGRVPTIHGYRDYLHQIEAEVKKDKYSGVELLRNILIANYKDTPLALHYIKQLLAKETDQVSFVAEPEMAYGYLSKLDVFKIDKEKLLFVISLDSGLDKTVIINVDFEVNAPQLKVLVKYVNEELYGLRIYDIQEKLTLLAETVNPQNRVFKLFLEELTNVLADLSSFFIHFEGSTGFIEQPEFDDKEKILNFFGLMHRQDILIHLIQKHFRTDKDYIVIMGEDFGQPQWADLVLIFAKYEIFDVPGYLGIIAPVRMDYKKNIPILRDIAQTITQTTKRGMMVQYDG